MGHNLQSLGTANLETMGGLVTLASHIDLPEGASPRCYDMDFDVGSTFTRAGLQSVYSFLNSFAGPNSGSEAQSEGSGNLWANPTNVFSSTPGVYASVTLGSSTNASEPTAGITVTSQSSGAIWSNPGDLTNASLFATVNLTNSSTFSQGLYTTNAVGLSVPSNAIIEGIVVTFQGTAGVGGSAQAIVQLTENGVKFGTPYSVGLSSVNKTYTAGSSGYLWGTSLSPNTTINGSVYAINGRAFGVNLYVQMTAGTSTNIQLNNLTITVYYTLSAGASALDATGFSFSLPNTATPTGIVVTFNALGAGGTVTMNLLKNGVPVGNVHTELLTGTVASYLLGGTTDLWGTTFAYSDINNENFGVQVTASGSGTIQVQDLNVEVFFSPSSVNFNYVKTYEQNDGSIYTVALDASGVLWVEDVIENPGLLQVGLTGLLPGMFAKSTTADDQEYVVFSNIAQSVISGFPTTISIGADRPRVISTQENISSLASPFLAPTLQYLPLSQVGPGAPPTVGTIATTNTSGIPITAYSLTSNVATFTYTGGTDPVTGQLFRLTGFPTGQGDYFNNKIVSVTSVNTSLKQFTIVFQHVNDAGATGLSASAQSPYSADITTIHQPLEPSPFPSDTANPVGQNGGSGSGPYDWQAEVQSTGPGTTTTPGNVVTVYYGPSSTASPDPIFDAMRNAGLPTYVQISGAQFGNGVWQVTDFQWATPPGDSHNWWYFAFQVPTSAYLNVGASGSGGGAPGQYQVTQATLITDTPLLGVSNGSTITITGASPSQWNGTWTIQTSNSFILNITSTALANGVATIGFNIANGTPGQTLTVGQLVTISGTNNFGGVFNTTAYITATDGTSTLSFYLGILGTFIQTPDSGQGLVAGTNFTFDPGASQVGETGKAIFGTYTGGGIITVTGVAGAPQIIGAGTRQAVVFFITESGYETGPSIPVQFDLGDTATYVSFGSIPIGPPNVRGRGIAITEAGQNGVPGANFYVIRQPVTITDSITGQKVTYTSTIINDNTTTSAQFTFTDAILLDGDEIDVQGNNLFNLIEIGSPAWVVNYSSRNFYGLMLNKVDNFINLTFDGGYLPNPGGNILPLGWDVGKSSGGGTPVTITEFSITSGVVTIVANNSYTAGQTVIILGLSTGTYLNSTPFTITSASSLSFQFNFSHANVALTPDSGTATSVSAGTTLITSPVTGMALYIKDTIEGITPQMGFFSQAAYTDWYGNPIIKPNTGYSVRVACSNPSEVAIGSLVIELVNFNQGTGFGKVYGSYNIPLASMSTDIKVFTGVLLANPFTTPIPNTNPSTAVPPGLRLAFYVQNMGYGADVTIDRIEVFETLNPYITAQVLGSYIDSLESVDTTIGSAGGIIDTTSENTQPCNGGFVMHDTLYFLKTKSMFSVEDNANSEPGGWGLREVSNVVGTCGINSYDAGEEWFVTACRAGIFGFNGGQPIKIMEEIYQIWDAINWFAGSSIVLRNDVTARKMFCAIPLPTPNKWLPYAPLNLAPTTPNVMLMLNYQGLGTFEQMVTEAQMHTTMFGTLAAVDMKRKWVIWQIPTPYMGFIKQQDGITEDLYICNGINSSKIYRLNENQYSDDGVPINSLYTTYGFVNAAKATTVPIFGMHAKRYTVTQITAEGSGSMQVKCAANLLADWPAVGQGAKYPWIIPGVLQLSGLQASITLQFPENDDFYRPLNIRGQRCFMEFQTNAVGDWFRLHRVLLSGKADQYPINPTGGGNVGFTGGQPLSG